MTHRFFRVFGTAAIAATVVLAAACSKKGEAEVNSSADAEGNVDAGASASVTGTAAAPPPASTGTGSVTGGPVALRITTYGATGPSEVKPGSTLRLPYGTNLMFSPALKMSAVSVSAGPFKTWQGSDGSVLVKFDPDEKQMELLEKGELLDATLQFSGGNLSFRVGKL